MKIPRGAKEIPDVFEIQTGRFMMQWCCDCGLRHIWHFKVLRGKTHDEDKIEISMYCDEFATKMLKQLQRKKGC